MGARKATCSFHSMPKLCHMAVLGLASNRALGNFDRSTVPVGALARYQGYTMYAPVTTAAQAATASAHAETFTLLTACLAPSAVSPSAFIEYTAYSTPLKPSRKMKPKTMPCTVVQISFEFISMISLLGIDGSDVAI